MRLVVNHGIAMHRSKSVLLVDRLCIFCQFTEFSLPFSHQARAFASTRSRRDTHSSYPQSAPLGSFFSCDAPNSYHSALPGDASRDTPSSAQTLKPLLASKSEPSIHGIASRSPNASVRYRQIREGRKCPICDSTDHIRSQCPQLQALTYGVRRAHTFAQELVTSIDSRDNGRTAEVPNDNNLYSRRSAQIPYSRDNTEKVESWTSRRVKSSWVTRGMTTKHRPPGELMPESATLGSRSLIRRATFPRDNRNPQDKTIRKLERAFNAPLPTATASRRDDFTRLLRNADSMGQQNSRDIIPRRIINEVPRRPQAPVFTGWGNYSQPIEEKRISKEDDSKVKRTRIDRLMERIEEGRGKRAKRGNDKNKHDARKHRPRIHLAKNDEDEDDRPWLDEEERQNRKAARKAERSRELKEREEALGPAHLRLKLPPFISVTNLATLLGVRQNALINRIQKQQLLEHVEYDNVITAEDAGLIAMEYGFYPSTDTSAVDLLPAPLPMDLSIIPPRPPVVTIMGHVDHGKTTILDYLRKSSIAAGEHGGITQHIGAFIVPLSSGKTITFLDTPGHAAFLTMRQRGANVTDIVVLVVAADDSVMPQTIEAIKHAKSSKVPIIVAVNKMDKQEANIDRVKQDLARHEVEIEDFGGDTQIVPVSGKTGLGMEELEEAIVTQSEILDHRAPRDGNVEGWIIEASTKNFGRVATVLVRRGTLRPSDIIVAGRAWGKVKTLRNEFGETIDEAGPGTPVEVDGWRIPPIPGDEVLQATDEQQASSVIKTRNDLADQLRTAQDIDAINAARRKQRFLHEAELAREASRKALRVRSANPEHNERIIEGNFVDRRKHDGVQEVVLVVKADVIGSAEAVVNLVSALGNNEVRPNIIHTGAGAVNESDVDLAASAGAYVLAFNTDIDSRVRELADEQGVEIIEQSVIYRIAEDVNAKLESCLQPNIVQRVTGEAELAATFDYKAKGKKLKIAGCRVRNGVVAVGSRVRVLRGTEEVYNGTFLVYHNRNLGSRDPRHSHFLETP
jgi:translation initiation factor IF-2